MRKILIPFALLIFSNVYAGSNSKPMEFSTFLEGVQKIVDINKTIDISKSRYQTLPKKYLEFFSEEVQRQYSNSTIYPLDILPYPNFILVKFNIITPARPIQNDTFLFSFSKTGGKLGFIEVGHRSANAFAQFSAGYTISGDTISVTHSTVYNKRIEDLQKGKSNSRKDRAVIYRYLLDSTGRFKYLDRNEVKNP